MVPLVFVLTVLFFLFLSSSCSRPERSHDKCFPFISLSCRYLEMIKKCIFFVFPFYLEASCQSAQKNASGADGEGTRSRAGKPRFQKRGPCQPRSSTTRAAQGGRHATLGAFNSWSFLLFIDLAPASRDPVFFTLRPTRLFHQQALAW